MLGQALFATGDYVRSANVTRQATQILQEPYWGIVVKNHAALYYTDAQTNDYVGQLKALENAASEHPNAASLRFLLGFHYGYLGYPKEAKQQLDKLMESKPQDEVGRRLRDIMAQQ